MIRQKQIQVQLPVVGGAHHSGGSSNGELAKLVADTVTSARKDGLAQMLVTVASLREHHTADCKAEVHSLVSNILEYLQVTGERLHQNIEIVDKENNILGLTIFSEVLED